MEQLEQKLARELPPRAKVVACRFPFPNWVPERTAGEGLDTVWLYDATAARGTGPGGRGGPGGPGGWGEDEDRGDREDGGRMRTGGTRRRTNGTKPEDA